MRGSKPITETRKLAPKRAEVALFRTAINGLNTELCGVEMLNGERRTAAASIFTYHRKLTMQITFDAFINDSKHNRLECDAVTSPTLVSPKLETIGTINSTS